MFKSIMSITAQVSLSGPGATWCIILITVLYVTYNVGVSVNLLGFLVLMIHLKIS